MVIMGKSSETTETRIIEISEGNIRNSHIYITGLCDFFPTDAFGGPTEGQVGKPITIELTGLDREVQTDIPCDSRTGRPRRHFRARRWARDFFRYHDVRAGDKLRLDRTGIRRYRLSLASGKASRPRFLEFFAGIGLVRMALERSGWELAYANDIDPAKQQMYQGHFGDADTHFDLTDIHDVSGRQLPDAFLATASFPCTDLSLAGKGRGLRGRQSSAFFGLTDILREMGERRPPLVLLENVMAFLTSHGGRDFETAVRTLNELGYCVDVFAVDAKSFVPQSRPRLFVVGSAVNHAEPQGPLGQPWSERLRPKNVAKFIDNHPHLQWSLRPLPEPPLQANKRLDDVLEDLPADAPEWWSEERAQYLYNQMSDRHRKVVDTWLDLEQWSYGTVFRRVRKQSDGSKRSMGELRWDGIAGCLRTPKGGSGRQIVVKAGHHKFSARLLTPRECARLMGADDYRITVSLNQALFGFGDAVCVPVVEWIAENYLNPLAAQVRTGYSELQGLFG